MKKFYYNLVLFLVAAVLAVGCTEDITTDELQDCPDKVKTEFMEVSAGLEFEASVDEEGETRTTLTDNNGGKVLWSEGDTVAAISADGTVTECSISQINGSTAKVAVPTDTKYAVYPYSADMKFSTSSNLLSLSLVSEVTLDGSKKVFNDKQNVMVAHLANGSLAFKNLCGWVEVKLTGSQTVKHIALRNNSGNWDALSGLGNIDFSDAAVPKITTGTNHGTTFNFAYAKCSDVKLSTSEATSFYFIVPPRTYQNMSICVQTDKGSYSIISNNTITVNRSKILPFKTIDLDALAPATATDLSEGGVANCYIVPQGAEAKSYSFPARKINGTANLENVAYAHVSWSEGAQLVNNVCYDAATGKVTFKYEGSNAEGNAHIALLDADHNIIWTNHIWCTDKPEDLVIHSGGVKYGVLDRHLGATHTPKTAAEAAALSESVAADTFGLYYQYGRPSPFPRIKDVTVVKEDKPFGNNTRVAVQYAFAKYNQVLAYSSAVNSYEKALCYPKMFYTISYSSAAASEATHVSSGTNDTWYGTTVYNPFTDSDKSWHSENAHTVSKKSDNDPCPAGYVVDEEVGAAAYMAGKSYTTVNNTTTNKAMGYYYMCPTSEDLVWLPAQGFRSRTTALANYVSSNYNLWVAYSSAPSNNLNCVRISGGNPSFNRNYTQQSQGFGIRCRMMDRSVLQSTSAAECFEGQGTEASPYLIKTASDMVKLSGLCGGSMTAEGPTDFKVAHYALANNINMSGVELSPIAPFSGTFDGKDCTISNVTIIPTSGAPAGMFGTLENATVKNLKIESLILNVLTNDLFAGGIAGKATGSTITNCNFNGTVASACAASFTSSSGTNGASAVVGGIVAYAINTTVTNCVISGSIETAKGQFTGGVSGHFEGGKIDKCELARGTHLFSTMNHTGGIVGRMTKDAEITNCTVNAPVLCGYAVNGGIAGRMQSGLIQNCMVTSESEVVGHKGQAAVNYTDTGGIVGILQAAANMGTKAIVKDCACYANVSANLSVGGIIGQLKNDPQAGFDVLVENCLFQGEMKAASKNNYNYSMLGGISGCVNNGYSTTPGKLTIKNCVALISGVEYAAAATNAGIGGVLGYAKYATIENCYSNLAVADIVDENGAPITGTTIANYGGLYGITHGPSYPTIYNNCYYLSTGKIGRNNGEPTLTATEGLTLTQMTDGTLLGKLNASATVFVANSAGYPIPSGVPADTGSATADTKTRVSLIGDSISTFKGWMPAGYNSFYPISTNPTVISATQTYWYKLIYKYMKNAKLDMNIAWTGTVVARSTDENYLATDHGAGHCFVERFVDDGMGNPDVILLHGGTNDCSNRGKSIAVHPNYPTYGGSGYLQTMCPTDAELKVVFDTADAATTRAQLEALNDTSFVEAYVKLLSLMHQQYPEAKVVMIIGDWIHAGTRQAIQKIAAHYGTKYGYKCVDLQEISPFQSYNVIPKESGCHPNEAGFEVMANYIYQQVGTYIDK